MAPQSKTPLLDQIKMPADLRGWMCASCGRSRTSCGRK